MEQPNPTLPANDIDLSKFVPAIGQEVPKTRRQIVDEPIDEDEPEGDDSPVELQHGKWEGAMDPEAPNPGDMAAVTPMYIPPQPALALTTDQIEVATRPMPTQAQIQREQLRQEQQQKRKTEAERKHEEGIFVGAVKGLLGLEKKKVDAQKERETVQAEMDKEASEKYELCRRLTEFFPNMVPHLNVRPGQRISTYDDFIAKTQVKLSSGKIIENGKTTAKWGAKLFEIGGSLVGLQLRGPQINFTDAMSGNIDRGIFDEEIKEIVVFYPHFFTRPLWMRVLEKVFFIAMAVHEANSGAASKLMAGPEASQHVTAEEMGHFAG